MAVRKFNIFQRTTGIEYNEITLSKNKKYRMGRDGTLVEYDDTVLASDKAAALASLDSQLGNASITQGEYDAAVLQLEKDYNSLEKLSTESLSDELVFSGSKSDIRKGEMAERNISVLFNTKADVRALRYDIAFFSPKEQPLNETIMKFVAPVPLVIGPNLSTDNGTQVKWDGFTTVPYNIAVKKNGVLLGNIRINTDQTFDITVVDGFGLLPGDVLSYHSPEIFEVDLTNISITVAANQVNK